IEEGADAITYSPIFETPNKGEPKGIEALQHVIKKYPIKIFALGGIVESSHVIDVEKSGAYGFASIRYFY
ncbi:MAG: thiamine phosphate synthase, partial [Sulfurimonadaceae bacterium]|nr:thiamine phosphate synthase [Sulfurimonadaceae bacterium]